jgi:ATP-dependent DNA ligase
LKSTGCCPDQHGARSNPRTAAIHSVVWPVYRSMTVSHTMRLPFDPPVAPMLAKRIDALPEEGEWIFEPKWDGFRALIFRDGGEILIQSRDEKSLNRYFPDLIEPFLQQLPEQCVLDGEIVIACNGALDFDALQLRIHPAASRVKLLAQQTPASFVIFDLLAEGKSDLRGKPLSNRQARMQQVLSEVVPPLHLTPWTTDRSVASDWFRRFEGAGLDGVIVKPPDAAYEPGKRVMYKVKHERDCDCLVAGFRWYKESEGTQVGSLLLGLYDDSGSLQHVGVCASFTKEKRAKLVDFLAPYRKGALMNHPWASWADEEAAGAGEQRMPGGKSRWSQGKDLSWQPLRPELVVEVAYEHMQGPRFRHMAHFRRWRTDKSPRECTYAQLEVVPAHELSQIFSQGR